MAVYGTHSRLPVFVCYAREDNDSQDPSKRWLDRLLQQLEPLALQNQVCAWSDRDIEAGSDRFEAIEFSLSNARAAILLISPAFLASAHIRSSQIPVLLRRAKEQGLVIIPILIRPCLFIETTFKYPDPVDGPEEFSLASIQTSSGPTRPLSALPEEQQDEVLVSVARRLLQIVQPSASMRQSQPPSNRSPEAGTAAKVARSPHAPKTYLYVLAGILLLFGLGGKLTMHVLSRWVASLHPRFPAVDVTKENLVVRRQLVGAEPLGPQTEPSTQHQPNSTATRETNSSEALISRNDANAGQVTKGVDARAVHRAVSPKLAHPDKVPTETIPAYEATAEIQPTKMRVVHSKSIALSQFELHPLKSGYIRNREIGFDGIGPPIPSFVLDPYYSQRPKGGPFPVFMVSLQNLTDRDVLITRVLYRVEKVGQVAGGDAGPLDPSVMYHHRIHWRTGDQIAPLVPAFRIGPKSSGAFLLELQPMEEEIGMAWLMQVILLSNRHEGVSTERFELIMTKGLPRPTRRRKDEGALQQIF